MLTDALARFPRLELITTPTPLEHLPRLSRHLGRDIWIKREDLTPLPSVATRRASSNTSVPTPWLWAPMCW